MKDDPLDAALDQLAIRGGEVESVLAGRLQHRLLDLRCRDPDNRARCRGSALRQAVVSRQLV
jgi:hypothetical protein